MAEEATKTWKEITAEVVRNIFSTRMAWVLIGAAGVALLYAIADAALFGGCIKFTFFQSSSCHEQRVVSPAYIQIVAQELAIKQTDALRGPEGRPGPKGDPGLPGKDGINGNDGGSADLATLLAGAVVAFNRSEGSAPTDRGACPIGWTLFREAGGRVIVGAGQHTNEGVPFYPSHQDNNVASVGGKQTHKHAVDGVPVKSTSQGGDDIGVVAYEAGGIDKGFPITTTEASSMPPFIALYYCEKDK